MTDPETPADVETDDAEAGALAALEAANYAEAAKGYQPPAEHATQSDQVDPVPNSNSAAPKPPTTDLRLGEAE